MVMTRPPAFHVWKFMMKNMIPTNSGLIASYFLKIELPKLVKPWPDCSYGPELHNTSIIGKISKQYLSKLL